jgi:hypothetical protein
MTFFPSSPAQLPLTLSSFITPARLLKPVFSPVESISCISFSSTNGPSSSQAQAQPSPLQRVLKRLLRAKSPLLHGVLSSSSSIVNFMETEQNIDMVLQNSNSRTRAPFKPQKAGRGTSSWQLKEYAEATLGSGSLKKAVKLPEGEDENEWLAVNGK